MLAPIYRLADRFGRVAIKSGLKLGAAVGQPERGARPAAGRARRRPFQLTLTARQMPGLVLILLVNAGVLVVATLIIEHVYTTGAIVAGPAITVVVTAALPSPPALATPLPGATSDPNVVNQIVAIGANVNPAPAGPTVTAPPNPLTLGGTLYYAYRHAGYTNLWAQVLGHTTPVRLTAGPWDDRDPAISPDGTRLAFASHRGGSWNLYLLDLTTGDTRQLTTGNEFKANPYWSPDGQYLVFELYRNDNLDIAIVPAEGGDIIPLTSDPAADYEPAWSPAGREIVWVSMRTGNPELWELSLDNPDERQAVQITNTPGVQESNPAFGPNGDSVVYTDAASPYDVIWGHSATDPSAPAFEAGQGLYPAWSPEGSSLTSVQVQENGPDLVVVAPLSQKGLPQIAFQAEAGHITGLAWSGTALSSNLPQALAQLSQVSDAQPWSEVDTDAQPAGSDPPYTLVTIPNLTAADPRLSDRVDEAFAGLRQTTAQAVGWDFLNTLDNAALDINAPLPPSLDFNSWLKTGRAIDVAQAAEQFGWVKITREDYGFHTFWRVWLLAAVQDGSEGEPLRLPPWNLAARYSGRPQPYDAGGEYASLLPPGYFVNFTMLADDYGWSRVPAQSNWRQFYPGIMYWRFEHRDGLDWLSAMREIYSSAAVATRTPVPSPTDTPTITKTPTPTKTATRLPTRTSSPTATRRPTITMTPTATHWPTITLTPSKTPRPTATPSGTWYTQTPTVAPPIEVP
jgi:TolB protein